MCCGVLLVYLYQQVVTYLAHHLVLSHDAHIYFNLLKPKISFLNHFHSSHPQYPLMFYLNQMIINLTLLLLKNTWQKYYDYDPNFICDAKSNINSAKIVNLVL